MPATEKPMPVPVPPSAQRTVAAAPRPVPAAAPAPTAAQVPARPAPAAHGVPAKPTAQPAATTTTRAAPKAENTWAAFFRKWPDKLPKRGVVISQLNESTVFKSFMLQGELVLLERISPDSVGARFVVLPFDEIASVRYTDQLPQEALESAGFVGKLAK